ncbi:hypothetical protein ACFXKF_33155 [Streptomyces scopuliridis]|uniref:hypothetical protein n=1 Tax=Streptomyces scopuliridis TaxID=452529 RepID=UPI0036A882D9
MTPRLSGRGGTMRRNNAGTSPTGTRGNGEAGRQGTGRTVGAATGGQHATSPGRVVVAGPLADRRP